MAPKAVKKPTFDYIKEAILGLKERGGSSPAAIKAWIAKTYPGANIAPHVLKAAFKSGVTSGKLSKVSEHPRVCDEAGGDGSAGPGAAWVGDEALCPGGVLRWRERRGGGRPLSPQPNQDTSINTPLNRSTRPNDTNIHRSKPPTSSPRRPRSPSPPRRRPPRR